jgi:nucleotide-binding universal stress UspA family protein
VTVARADGPVVSAPQVVEYVKVPPSRPADRLLELAADTGAAAVLVGAGVGLRCVRALVRRATCSVWFIPDGAVPSARRILVPVDFTVRAADCLRVATVLARLSDAGECLALHVYFNASLVADAAQDRRLRAGMAERYAQFLGPIDLLNVPVRPLFRECAIAADAVNQTAADQDADLIVLATRGRTPVAALLDESLAEQTLRHCRVPLLVVKHFGARLGLLSLLRDPDFGRRNVLRCN